MAIQLPFLSRLSRLFNSTGGVANTSPSSSMPRPPTLDKEQIALLSDLYILGLSRGQIAFLYNVRRDIICGHIFRLGITHKGPRSPNRQQPSSLIAKEP